MPLLLAGLQTPTDELHRLVVLGASDLIVIDQEESEAGHAVLDPPNRHARTIPNSDALVVVPTLLSIQTVAAILMCSTKTVRRRIQTGLLPAVNEQGLLRVRGDDLLAYIDGLGGRAPRQPLRRSSRRHEGWSGLG